MKTKFGISAGAYAAFTFLIALFGGYVALTLAVGLVIVFEKNEWLRATVVKAMALTLCFSILNIFLGAVPDLFRIINETAGIFNGSVSYGKLTQVVTLLKDLVNIFERVIFLLLALFALKMKTIGIGFIDKFVEKHLSLGDGQ